MNKLLFFVLAVLTACSSNSSRIDDLRKWKTDNGKIKVLSTTAMINDVVSKVGGDHIDSLTLIQGELNPHSYQLVKGDDEKLGFAHLIFFNGLGLEHGPSLQHYLYQNQKTVGLGDQILKKHPELILHYNGQLDPHIWTDISLWAKTVSVIVDALSKIQPQHAEDFERNGQKTIQEMIETHKKVQELLASVPENKRFLVTSHDAFNYFTRAYLATDEERANNDWQKRFAAPEGLAPESQLSTYDIQLIINHLRMYDIHILFPESNVSKDSIRKILNAGEQNGLNLQIAATYLYGDAMGRPGSDGDTYLKMILHNASIIQENLMKYN